MRYSYMHIQDEPASIRALVHSVPVANPLCEICTDILPMTII